MYKRLWFQGHTEIDQNKRAVDEVIIITVSLDIAI